MLRTTQRFRLTRRIEDRLRARGPGQPPPRGFELRALAARGDRQQAALPLDHHAACLAQRGCDQRDPRRRITLGDLADPFGPGAGLAKAASGHDQPDRPGRFRRQLAFVGPQPPVLAQALALLVGHSPQQPAPFVSGQGDQESGALSVRARHRPGPAGPAWPRWRSSVRASRRSSRRSNRTPPVRPHHRPAAPAAEPRWRGAR